MKTMLKQIGLSKILSIGLFLLGLPLLAQEGSDLHYATPEEVGLDGAKIDHAVDSLMTLGITNHAFPGATLLVAKDDKIIFKKAYGYHTYDSIVKTGPNDLYDLASVTKTLGPLPALMQLYDAGKIKLDVPFSVYWKRWQNVKNKKDITLREILTHQAGLVPYIIFQAKVTRKNGKLKKRFIHDHPGKGFTHQIYDSMYIKDNFNRKMYRIIDRSEVSETKKYLYSGLTFLIFPELISQLTGMPYEEYVNKNIYKPLGTTTLGYTPKEKHLTNPIVPTEMDSIYRKVLVHGWVHDENASLLGGVSGNAGLFSDAEDLARIMMMYENLGNYNGKQFISKKTMEEFISVQYPENDNRRGLGFDKPLMGNDTLALADAYPSPLASPRSFGHSGFTGTFVWADPDKKLVFIFLSNRVNPTRNNRSLYSLNIRTALMDLFYRDTLASEKSSE